MSKEKELNSLLAAVEKTVSKEEGSLKKERAAAREFILGLANKLEPIRRRKFSELDAASQNAIMAAMQAADECLRATTGRRIFEAQKAPSGERMDHFSDPVEATPVWCFIERLKRQSIVITEAGELTDPPPARPRSNGHAAPMSYGDKDTGEKLGDVATIVDKRTPAATAPKKGGKKAAK